MPKTIRNDTPTELVITGADGRQIILAPLELRQFNEEVVKDFDLSEASLAAKITEWTAPPSELADKVFSILLTVGVMLIIACGVLSSSGAPAWFPSSIPWKLSVWIGGVLVLVAIVVGIVIREKKALGLVPRFLAQMISLLVILAIGLGLPAVTVYFFGEGRALLASPSPKLFARLLQVSFIATASLLPVLLFFLFDRYQLNTLRNRLYRDLFRLDRGLATRSEIDAKYGSQIHEAYGPEDQGSGRLARGTRWPVLVCAFVVTIGWLAAFKPVGEITSASVQNPLFPERSVLTFGFLGAYFFGLQLIARRYARGDLKPKAYGYITIRILTVAVLSWVLEVFSATSSVTLLTAFLIGILPEELFTLIKENFRGRTIALIVPESEKHPLTKLEGIDLYDRARLEQEGIVNVESFAHHDLIHLVLETRIPVPQLVDWMDQAILYLHIIEEPTSGEEQVSARLLLRSYGIRTATDFQACWDAAAKRGNDDLDEFKKLLGGASKPYRLEVIRDSLLDDEWLHQVENWRDDADREGGAIDAGPKSFEGKLRWAEKLENDRRYNEAIQTLNRAIEIRDEADARIRLASLFARVPVLSLRDVNRYREHARRAFELGQSNVDVLMELVDIHDDSGDTDDALRACVGAIQLLGDPGKDKAKKDELENLNQRKKELEQKKVLSEQSASP